MKYNIFVHFVIFTLNHAKFLCFMLEGWQWILHWNWALECQRGHKWRKNHWKNRYICLWTHYLGNVGTNNSSHTSFGWVLKWLVSSAKLEYFFLFLVLFLKCMSILNVSCVYFHMMQAIFLVELNMPFWAALVLLYLITDLTRFYVSMVLFKLPAICQADSSMM